LYPSPAGDGTSDVLRSDQHPDPRGREEDAEPQEETAPARLEPQRPPRVDDPDDAEAEEQHPEHVPGPPYELGRLAPGEKPAEEVRHAPSRTTPARRNTTVSANSTSIVMTRGDLVRRGVGGGPFVR
jgi:hypothetical protein